MTSKTEELAGVTAEKLARVRELMHAPDWPEEKRVRCYHRDAYGEASAEEVLPPEEEFGRVREEAEERIIDAHHEGQIVTMSDGTVYRASSRGWRNVTRETLGRKRPRLSR